MIREKKPRLETLDALRGLALMSMIVFHFCFDVFIVWGRDLTWYARPMVILWQQVTCWIFILLAGLSWSWGKGHHIHRGLLLNAYGLGISLVTSLVTPGQAVWFGILNFMGCATLLLMPLRRWLSSLPVYVGVLGSLVGFYLTKDLSLGYLGVASWKLELPRFLYDSVLLTPVGFPFPGFASSDYFPLLPWFFVFVAGYCLTPLLSKFGRCLTRPVPLLSWLGRHSLWVYLLHQPLCLLLCFFIFGS